MQSSMRCSSERLWRIGLPAPPGQKKGRPRAVVRRGDRQSDLTKSFLAWSSDAAKRGRTRENLGSGMAVAL